MPRGGDIDPVKNHRTMPIEDLRKTVRNIACIGYSEAWRFFSIEFFFFLKTFLRTSSDSLPLFVQFKHNTIQFFFFLLTASVYY